MNMINKNEKLRRLKISKGLKRAYKEGRRKTFVSEETRRKISRSLTGKKHSKETIEKRNKKISGKNNYNWKGGKSKNLAGYIVVNRTKEYEHRIIVEKYLKRKLTSDEQVHHLNGIKDDNRINNLVVVDKKDHARKHFVKNKVWLYRTNI